MTQFFITNDIIGSLSPGTAEVLEALAANPPNNQSVNTVTSNTPSTSAATLEYVDSIFENTASKEYVDSKTSNTASVDYVDSKVSEAASVEYVDSKVSKAATVEYVDSKTNLIEGGNDTLRHFVYNPITDKLEADRAIETTLNSLFLGEQHKMSSGAENIFFTNKNSEINFFPMWGGVKDQSKGENQVAGQGTIKPSGRCYGDFVEVEPNGPVDLTSNGFLSYNSATFFANSVSGLGIQFYIGEPISSADIVFCYKLSIDDIAVYEQILDIPNDLAIGDLVDWYFDHPVEIHGGTNIVAGVFKTSRETKIVGDAVVVFPSTDPAKRYFKLRSRSFEDVDIVMANNNEFSGDVKVGSDIVLEHSTGTITANDGKFNGEVNVGSDITLDNSTGKITTNSTQPTDEGNTVVTKDYLDSKTSSLEASDVDAVSSTNGGQFNGVVNIGSDIVLDHSSGKITTNSTQPTDEANTVVTKDYVDSKTFNSDASDVDAVSATNGGQFNGDVSVGSNITLNHTDGKITTISTETTDGATTVATKDYVDNKTSSLEASDVDAVSATNGGQFNGDVSVGSNITLNHTTGNITTNSTQPTDEANTVVTKDYVDNKTSGLEASDVDAISATNGGQYNGDVSVGSNITLNHTTGNITTNSTQPTDEANTVVTKDYVDNKTSSLEASDVDAVSATNGGQYNGVVNIGSDITLDNSTGKITTKPTEPTDEANTVVTKDYVDNITSNLDATNVDAVSATNGGQFNGDVSVGSNITLNHTDGKITTISTETTDGATTVATKDYVDSKTSNLESTDVDAVSATNGGQFNGDVSVGSNIILDHTEGKITTVSTETTDGATTVATKDYVDSLKTNIVEFIVSVSGGKYLIDGALTPNINLSPGVTYKFNQIDNTNSNHPLKLSITPDGTHGGGSVYNDNVIYHGTAGSDGYTEIIVNAATPDNLYYYCANHANMGGDGVINPSAQNLVESLNATDVDAVSATNGGQFNGVVNIGTDIALNNSTGKITTNLTQPTDNENTIATKSYIDNKAFTITSAVVIYDIHVKSGYNGNPSDDLSLNIYSDIESALADSKDGDTVYLDGIFDINSEIIIPPNKSLFFYGNDFTCVQYSDYNTNNGSIFKLDGNNNSARYKFKNIQFKNAGKFAISIASASQVDIVDCVLKNNGWSGNGLDLLNEESQSTLGFNSSTGSLQTFYSTECSEGGAIFLSNIGKVEITDNTVHNNNKSIEIIDSGFLGDSEALGFIARNQIYNNISIGIDLKSSTGNALAGCRNFTIYNNAVNQNGDTGVKIEGGINNTLSLGVLKSNWNSGIKLSHVANTRIRDLDLDNNNRASIDAKGNLSDGLASLQMEGDTLKDGATFITEVFNLQIHNTNMGSSTNKTGLLIKQDVGYVIGTASIIKLDNIGFIEQDYALDIAANLDNLRLVIGDCEYIDTRIKTVRLQTDLGGYSELPFSTFVTDVPYADFTKDNVTKTISILDGPGGKVINTYHKNHITTFQKNTDFDIILTNTDKIQLRGLTEDRVYINGVAQTGTLSDVVNALNAFFTETEGTVPTIITTPIVNDEGTTVTTTTGNDTIDPTGEDEFAGNSTGYNNGYVFANQAIDQSGEYYTFKIRKEGIIGMGFHKSGSTGIYSLENLGTGTGNGHYGLYWSTWFHPTSDGPWTYYGEASGQTSLRSGWYSFAESSTGADWLADEIVLMKAGIDNDGYLYLSYYDTTSEKYIVITKNSRASQEGDLFHLVIKFGDQNVRLHDTPKVHLRSENDLGSGLPEDETIYLFGTATGTLGGGVSVPDATGQKSGIVTSATISELGQYFEFTRVGTRSSYAGLSNVEDFSPTFIQSEMNSATSSVLENKFFYAGGFIYYERDSWQPHGLVDPDGSSSGFSFNNGSGYLQRQNNSFRIGIDFDGKITYWQKQDDNPYVVAAKSVNTVPENTNLNFLWKAAQNNAELTSLTIGQLDNTPLLTYYAIESPDGQWHYPIFQTAEEANYFDSDVANIKGSGTSHTHVYVDDLSGTTWYMPDNGSFMNSTSPPSATYLSGVTFNYVATGNDSDYTPSEFNQSINIGEGETLNLQIVPADATFTTNVVGLPIWLSYNNGILSGTAPYVPYNEINLIQVNRSNAFGTTNGTLTLTVTDKAAISNIAGGTIIAGSNTFAPNQILPHLNGALIKWDTKLNWGQEMVYSVPSSGNFAPSIGILNPFSESYLNSSYDVNTSPLSTSGGTSENPGSNFSWRSQWTLRYVTFDGLLGTASDSEKYLLTGWQQNNSNWYQDGYWLDAEIKLQFSTDGHLRLYRGGDLIRTSELTFTPNTVHTIYFAGFDENNPLEIPSNLVIRDIEYNGSAISGWTHLTSSTNLVASDILGDGSAVQLDLELRDGDRIIFYKEWVEANILGFMDQDSESADEINGDNNVYLGVLSPDADVSSSNSIDPEDFKIAFFWHNSDTIRAVNNHRLRTISEGTLYANVGIGSKYNPIYDFAFDYRGGRVEALASISSNNNVATELSIANGGMWNQQIINNTFEIGETLRLVIGTRYGKIKISNTGVSRISSPLTNNQFLVTEDTFSLPLLVGPSLSEASTPANITLNAGQTYKFYLNSSSIENNDILDFVLTSDSSVYTTGVTSSGTPGTAGAYVEFAIPQDVPPINLRWRSGGVGTGTSYGLNISGSTYVVPVTGITLEGPTANQTGNNLFNSGDYGWLSINNQISAGQRLILDNAFLIDLADAMPNNSQVLIGLKDSSWQNTINGNSGFEGTAHFTLTKTNDTNIVWFVSARGAVGGNQSGSRESLETNDTELFIEITPSGNNIRLGFHNATQNFNDISTTTYSDWINGGKAQTGEQGYGLSSVDIMVLGTSLIAGPSATLAMDSSEVDWTALTEISIPTAPVNGTSWTKAIDFSGGSQRAEQATTSHNYIPQMLGGRTGTHGAPLTSGYTSTGSNARPWALAIVFKPDRHNSNQHIWNVGQGAGNGDNNVFLRLSADGSLYLGWGQEGSGYNECLFASGLQSTVWYGVYIAFTGERLSGSNATAANLANCFDIRLATSTNSWNIGTNRSTTSNWVGFGIRMDRQISGSMTLGGRGANRTFHGKIASFVSTTLMTDFPMPADAEIEKMITDPTSWVTDYKVGIPYRRPTSHSQTSNFQLRSSNANWYEPQATQVWLMGDGNLDSYSNMIRNQINPNDQNYTRLVLTSMDSNDIETVSIPGLS